MAYSKKRNSKNQNVILITILISLLLFVSVISVINSRKKENAENNETSDVDDNKPADTNQEDNKENEQEDVIVDEKEYSVSVTDEGEIVFYSSSGYYRYGPSIMKYEDGSMDAWFSSPGNSGSQWDWITYRHSDNGIDWSSEQIVLRPTPGSKDQCSVCDPGVIYFNDYYYLGYTATDYYNGKGSYNMAFVARSKNPDGPYEKWNGNGWGGNPEPIIFYDGAPDNWGIGEVSFVIYDEDLFIYYTYIDVASEYIGLCKADLTDDWPGTIRDKGATLYQVNHDSVEVVYDKYRNTFFAFSINYRLTEDSKLIVYESGNGKDFSEIATVKEGIDDYAHNLGVAKSPEGWINSDEELLIGYAYGKNWGRWNTRFQHIKLSEE